MYFICSKYKTNTVVYKENKQGCVSTNSTSKCTFEG